MPQLDSVGVVVKPDGFSQISPGLDYSNPDALFLTNTIYGSGYGKVPMVEDRLKGARLQATFAMPDSLPWFSDVDVGVNYADRRKDKTQAEGNILLGDQGDANIAGDLQYAPVNLGFAGIGYIPAWNVPAAVDRYMVFNPVTNLDYLIPKAWTVQEKTSTAWIRANINTDLGEVGLRGNIGVQMVRTDQSSQSNYFDRSRPDGQNSLHVPAPADAAFRRGQAGGTPARGPDARRPGVRRGHRHRQARRQRRQPAAGSVARQCDRSVLRKVLR
jgi:iron complex outermembrane recepter protein